MTNPEVSNDSINKIVNISDNDDRSPLVDKIDEIVSDLAAKIFDRIKERVVYKDFSAAIGSDKIPFYFQGRVRAEIKPYIIKMLENRSVYIPEKHIFLLLRELLESYGITMEKHSNLSGILELGSLSIREFFKRKRLLIANIWNRLWHDRTFKGAYETNPMIGVYLSEGIDTGKKSDIHWLPQSHIEPDRVLLFIHENSLEKKYGLFVRPNKPLLKELKASPFRWVFIPQKMLTGMYKGVWAPKKIKLPKWVHALDEKVSDGLDKWIFNICKELLCEIDFWKSFLEEFNVKILYYSGEGSTTVIAQGIAFDVLGEKSGFTVGKQRSDIGHSLRVLTAYHTKDVVFTWNSRNPEYFRQPYNRVCSQIVAGHPNDANFLQHDGEMKKTKELFKRNGAAFIIALFDSGHGSQYHYNFSSAEMEMVYTRFLNWVLEENTLGLAIKSKKPYILETLPNIRSLLKSAEETGRCIRLPFSYFPSTTAQIADMVVGLSISTAATEAVIAGSRGIHYHSKFPRTHEYYKWGYGKLVFDDLDLMMKALKGYKADKSSNPELGDWTPYLDLIDPFRDGRAGERMGTYFKWCLEGFDAGLNRNDVIKQANEKYASRWGDDKVIKAADIWTKSI
ncbi:MAG: hypothetical protein HY035_10580 [Nitrospirae bacterium]|nr:hypothetical protein [Nitrospirota bacterium]MBI3378823.1 hypothetical protein [Nitrospirota bacterium]